MKNLFIIFGLLSGTYGLTGFDCGGRYVNITTVSLLQMGDCDFGTKPVTTKEIYVQLLQIADFELTPFIQCQVSVKRTISYCGMHSHTSAVHQGYAEYLRDVPLQQCERMHKDGILSLANGNIIEHLKPNTTGTYSVTMAGKLTGDGKCQGVSYADSYGSWDNVIVQAIFKITLRSGYIPVKLNTGKVTLRSGTICELADGTCLDMEDGYTFWQTIPNNFCNFNHYNVLYEGKAQKITEEDTTIPEIYSLIAKDTTFALAKTTEIKICGFTLTKTEHPKLLILETTPGDVFAKTKPVAVENLDMFAYVNSKFIYVEKHLKSQITTMYKNIMIQKCELEQQVIANALAIARTQPDEFAYIITKGPGHMAVVAGEAIHIMKCVPVEVTLRHIDECYDELPVTYKKENYFLQPKTHILKKIGTKGECNRLLPILYKFDETWIRFLPKPIDAPTPTILKPHSRLTWKYQSAGNLATSGIYSEEELENLREHIMFPAEKPAMLNNIIQGIAGKQALGEGMSLYNLMDEETIDKLTGSITDKIWNGFISFGSISAGLLAIFIIIRLIKIIFDTLIQGYALHTVYGCSIQLIGALFTSVTHLLLHFAKPQNTENIPTKTRRTKREPEEGNSITDPIELQPLRSNTTIPPREDSPMTYFKLNENLQLTK